MYTELREWVSAPNVISCTPGRTHAVLLRDIKLALGTFHGCRENSVNSSLFSEIIVGPVQWGQKGEKIKEDSCLIKDA